MWKRVRHSVGHEASPSFLMERAWEDFPKVNSSRNEQKHIVRASHLAFSLGGRGVRDSSGTRSTGSRALQRKTKFNMSSKIWEQFSSPHLGHPLLRLNHSGKKQKQTNRNHG